MFPLLNPAVPADRLQLIASLTHGLGRMLHFPAGRPVVAAEGNNYPALTHLALDVSGATVKENYRPARAAGRRQPGIAVERLEVVGRPLRHDASAFDIDISAREVCFELDVDGRAGGQLVPVDAREGRLCARIDQANLEALCRGVLQASAADHDLTIEKTELMLSGGGRELAMQLRITGMKKLAFAPVRAVVRTQGQLVIDDALIATIRGLSCEGEGMIGTMAAGLFREQMKPWEGRSFPLTAFSLGSLKLHDVQVSCERGLHIEARLGS
jgi:hypothetical protein